LGVFRIEESQMKKMLRFAASWLLLALAALMTGVASVGAQSTGTVEEHIVPSPAIGTNLIGDSAEKRVLVYLPPGYENSGERYATIYLLHGIFGSPDEWVQAHRAVSTLDRGMGDGDWPHTIVVMPTGSNALGGGYYRDSPITGGWGTFISKELVDFVDTRYRTITSRSSRAVVGHSMGGYGAIHLAMESPEVFGVAYAMSPGLLSPIDDVGQGNPIWQTVLGMAEWGDVAGHIATRSITGLYAAVLLGVSMAWTEEVTDEATLAEFPYAIRNGETVINPTVHSRWMNAFPARLVDERAADLKSLRAFGMDYGVDEQFAHIQSGVREMAGELSRYGVPFRLDVYQGDHRNRVVTRLREIVFPFLLENLIHGH